jgi:predicted DsbA family dithiol-disulfide isomerase
MALQSGFSAVAGVPLSLLLVASYGALLLALWKDRESTDRDWAGAAALLCLGLLGGGIFLLGVMAQAESYCPLCLLMDGCNALLTVAWVSTAMGRSGALLQGRSLAAFGLIFVLVTGAGVGARQHFFPTAQKGSAAWSATGDGSLQVAQCQDVELSALEISDFLCPYCKNLERNLSSVLSECGARVDKRFVHFPLDKSCNRFVSRDMHPGACRLAEASECARLQGKFPGFASKLFEVAPRTDDALMALALELELDAVAFKGCLDTHQTLGRVRTDIELAHRLGVRSTPTFYLNGRRLEGALSPERLQREIAIALDKDVREVKTLGGGVVGDDPWATTEPVEACGAERFSQKKEGCSVDREATGGEGHAFP